MPAMVQSPIILSCNRSDNLKIDELTFYPLSRLDPALIFLKGSLTVHYWHPGAALGISRFICELQSHMVLNSVILCHCADCKIKLF